ncbi:hypothetical protein DY000_02051585 [Brassica cretica]|uniref:Uncharacterized protein n=1 Tax=Brassica cretica TaxID=69181 RepID=A0ABQ7F3T7_BRACR|nr:hypothetical protein DY000_02051585 [Brassica cretica]
MAESRNQGSSYTIPNIDAFCDGYISCMEAISGLSITSRNLHLPVQGGSVEYLPEHQKLKIPAALGMSWTTTIPTLCHTRPTLYSRFWKVASMPYTEIESLVKTIHTTTVQKIREVVDGLEMMTPSSERPTWETMEEDSDEMFGNLSKVLQFNCDIRDFGYLLTENATVTDSAWCSNVDNVSSARLRIKLKPYTLHMIAALNLGSVGDYPLGAWVRAYGLGVGIYPALGSAFKTEAVCTTKLPSTDDEADVLAFQQSYEEDKNYVRGDEYIGRIGNSYLETLKTLDTANVITTKHKECLLRIAPHPFGIAQTYWLAKVMYKHQLIMPYLALRFNLPTPPPIQRIIVILEAAREWENLPAARDVLEMFSANLSRLKTQEIAIKEAPPSEVLADLTALMPATCGFTMVAHVSKDGKKKDGIALARCLKSVERNSKFIGNFWKKLWRNKLQ